MDDAMGSEGWYPDPSVPNQMRWWNAVEWTEHTRPAITKSALTKATPIQPKPKPEPEPAPVRRVSTIRVTRAATPPLQAAVGKEPVPADEAMPGSRGRKALMAAGALGVIGLAGLLGAMQGRSANNQVIAIAEPTSSVATTAPVEDEVAVLGTTTIPAETTTTFYEPIPADVETALAQLSELEIAEPSPERSAYIRDEYQPGGWSDFDQDCQSTRHEILQQQSTDEVVMDAEGCKVLEGRWKDSFNGDLLTSADEATIDHLVPLAEAHRSGGWKWDQDTKEQFANDDSGPHFRVVGAHVNQSKGDSRPDQWLPPNEGSHCAYAADWIAVKHRWELTVKQSEADALQKILVDCSGGFEIVPFADVAPETPVTQTEGLGVIELISCDRRSERVVITNTGGEAIRLSGYELYDEGSKHRLLLGSYGTLAPGKSLTVVSGEDAVADLATNTVVWKPQDVWNNDGDTAFLIAPNNTSTSLRCSAT